jgi:hypothetical protein
MVETDPQTKKNTKAIAVERVRNDVVEKTARALQREVTEHHRINKEDDGKLQLRVNQLVRQVRLYRYAACAAFLGLAVIVIVFIR